MRKCVGEVALQHNYYPDACGENGPRAVRTIGDSGLIPDFNETSQMLYFWSLMAFVGPATPYKNTDLGIGLAQKNEWIHMN